MSTAHLLPTFARVDLAFEKGEGAWLTATNGERYLDFTSGVAVNALGHAHPKVADAIAAQAHKAIHVSNLFRVPEQEKLADRLCAESFADYVFFCNSGAEAMEGAIKTARKFQAVNGHPERYRIITFEGAFHGRTLATLAAGGQKKYLEGFGPVVEGFDQVPFGDLEAVKKVIGPETAAILIEPIQGEGGVRVPSNMFLKSLRALADQHGLLLIFDEVQTGMGRTGELFAYQRTGVEPDIMALAKRSEEHTSELQSPCNLVCRLLLEKKKIIVCSLRALSWSIDSKRASASRHRCTASASRPIRTSASEMARWTTARISRMPLRSAVSR